MSVFAAVAAVALLSALGLAALARADSADRLAKGFADPPREARPQTWWHWMNGNVSKEGVTADLEAMAAIGLGGAQIFDAGCEIPPGGVAYNTPAWTEMIRHAAKEAKRLGLELCLANCSGWSSSGGPWTQPSNAMMRVAHTARTVRGGERFRGRLEPLESAVGFSRDLAVLALPAPGADETVPFDGFRKQTFLDRDGTMPCEPISSDAHCAGTNDVIDLTARMAADGSLDWSAPAGRDWTVLRIGYVAMDVRNRPASQHGVGLECDKLSSAAVRNHFDGYVGTICTALGDLAGGETGVTGALVDSYEVGLQNWTPGFEREFLRLRGYDMRPFLPVLAGRTLVSREVTRRFLSDFRRTVADLFASNYAGTLAACCHARGLRLSLEPYGNCPSDDFQYGQFADIPMGEFWSSGGCDDGGANGEGNARYPAALAHVWGRRIAAMESFTAPPGNSKWRKSPFAFKAQGDRVLAAGVNRIVYHRFAHQPWAVGRYLPGMTMGMWGVHFDRTQTWWPFGRAFIDCQARCQWMLQEGAFVADALFFTGERAPDLGAPDNARKLRRYGELPDGYAWDWCAREALLKLRADSGAVVAPGGTRYRMLVLPDHAEMSPEALEQIGRLVAAGATVVAESRPVRVPGLKGYPAADAALARRAEEIWSAGVLAMKPADALAKLGLGPDFTARGADVPVRYQHRRHGDGTDAYFVALANATSETVTCSFRLKGREPELWNPETGARTRARRWRPVGDRTEVTVDFNPSGATFVVFRGGRSALPLEVERRVVSETAVKGPWTATFPVLPVAGCAPSGEMKTVRFDELASWTASVDPDIRYFSGAAVYGKTVDVGQVAVDERVELDLGDVRNLAEVTVNGRMQPVLWKPPFRLDVTEAARTGALELSVRVVNLWPNRLIGDDILFADDCEWLESGGIREIPAWVKEGRPSPTGRHTFTTWKHWTKKDRLLDSGLLGPVVIRRLAPDFELSPSLCISREN